MVKFLPLHLQAISVALPTLARQFWRRKYGKLAIETSIQTRGGAQQAAALLEGSVARGHFQPGEGPVS